MNPELQRHLWLELSVHRLVAMPCVLALIFLLAALSDPSDTPARLTTTGCLLFIGLAGLWGTRRAAEAVTEEWRSKTWDSQRLSALSPWQMTWGKLLGSTAFAWYGALPCLVVVALAWPPDWEYDVLAVLVSAVCSAVALQASGLIASLLAARKGLVTRLRGFWVVLLFLLLSVLNHRFFTIFSADVTWWGHVWEGLYFSLATAVVGVAWAVFGAYRLMSQELQVRTTPWAWVAFLVFLACYLAGFVVQAYAGVWLFVFLLAELLVSGALTYLMLFSEQTGILLLRRVWVRAQRREWRRALEELPCWLVSLGLATVCVLALLCMPAAREVALLETGQSGHFLQRFALPLLLFLYRDTAIFLGFSLRQWPRRVEATSLLYLGLLYLVVPGLCKLLDAPVLLTLVLPPVFTQPLLAGAVLAGHLLLALSVLGYRWRQSYRHDLRPGAARETSRTTSI